MEGLKAEGIPYKGFIFFGLMNVDGDPYVIEYNCRLGDPETESVLPRIRTDFVALLKAVADSTLHTMTLDTDPSTVASVMLVSAGYPDKYEKGKEITGLEKVAGSFVFPCGHFYQQPGPGVTNGGRVISVTSFGNGLKEALERSYAAAR